MDRSLAVIMTVHNRRDSTVECIRHFYNCHGIENYDIEFYMMDDGSTDGTAEAVATAFPQVIILQGDGNLFWNRGMYYCWKEAILKRHDFYLWLNDDTMLFDNALEVLFVDYETAGRMSIISGCCCDTATRSITTYGGRSSHRSITMNGTLQPIEWMNGNVVLIPNIVVEKIGINDPYFHHSKGDCEYGCRARKEGINVLMSSSFVGTCDRHDGGLLKSMDSRFSLKERLHYLNTPLDAMPKETFYLFRKYKSFWSALFLYFMAYVNCFFPPINNKRNK